MNMCVYIQMDVYVYKCVYICIYTYIYVNKYDKILIINASR